MRSALVLALLAAGASSAGAAKLDRAACDALRTEFAGASAVGLKDDMARGPEWARINLPPERMLAIKRMIEVQEQLEFRCGMRGNAVAKAAPGKPEAPGAKTDAPADAKNAGAAANASPQAPAGTAPASTAAMAAGANTPPAAASVKSPVATDATMQAAATPPASVPAAAPITPPSIKPAPSGPQAVTPGAATPAAKASTKSAARKRSRRESSSAYVPPSDVSPFLLSPLGGKQ